MSLPEFSVHRPVFTTMVFLMILVIGAVALSRLKIDMLPEIEMPTLSIRTEFIGASPEIMERQVTQVIEEIISTVPGVEEITSDSSEGNSNVQVRFTWETDIDFAALDVRSVLEDEFDELPDDIERPRIRKFDIGSFPVVLLGISSRLDPVDLTQLIEDEIRYRFSRIPGVAQVDIWGGFDREIRIELDPDRIMALGLPLDQIIRSVRQANLDPPAGKLEQGRYEIQLRAPAQFSDLDQIRNTVVARQDGAAVTLGQVARVNDTYEKLTRIIRVNGEPGIRVAIRKQSQANTVDVSNRILDEIDAVNTAMPQIRIIPVINQGNFIQRSITNVARSVMYGGGLAVLILLFFLRTVRSTVVIALAIPISMLATFALMFFFDLTINLMTLGGLALGVGMMVDNSIVVLENIFRHRNEYGTSPETASKQGAMEVAPAILASTITTLVIFLPLIFVRGISGILFTEMAYVIIFSLTCSLLVALSLVPMLTSRLLGIKQRDKTGSVLSVLFSLSESFFVTLQNGYTRLLTRALNRRWIPLILTVAALCGALILIPEIGTEFLPPSDEGEVRITGEMEVGTRLDLVDRQSQWMESIIYPAVPEAVSSVVSIGASGHRPGNAAKTEVRISLNPSSQRERSNIDIARDLRQRLANQIPGMEIRTRAPQGQFIMERILGGEDGLKVEIRGYDLNILESLADRASRRIETVPGVTDIELSRETGTPRREIHVDRDKAADLGLSVQDITNVLSTAVAGAKAGEYQAEGESHRIFVQLRDVENRSLDDILDLTLTTASGQQVALKNLVSVSSGWGPLLIDRKDQQRIISVSANVSGRDMGSVAAEVTDRLNGIPRPAGYDMRVAGDFEEQQKAFRELVVSLVLALILVYMVMACQYESLVNPLVVMFSVPMAIIGVLGTLYLTHTTLNVQSWIGCIMLGGIVVNNAILLVDQSSRLSRQGMMVHEAVKEAGRRRLRPILMTSLTTILGLTPLALGIGEGADAQAPLARAVVGGLTGSTLITLILIPIIYSFFHPDSKKARS
ncbi:MAG: efflux RND transporter permease subunit [Desulfotignum sp.]|nr:efflux RND transporter permease subunit [Desulfotignum sp.]